MASKDADAKAKSKAAAKGKAKAKKEEVEEDKVPAPDRDAHEEACGKIAEKISALQVEAKKLSEKITERTGGKDEYNIKRSEYRGQLDEFSKKIDELMARKEQINKARGDQRQEQADMRSNLNKMKKNIGYTNEADIDERIAQIERQMVTESMPLKQEKDLIKEISDLKKRRPQISKVKGMEENLTTVSGGNFKEQLDIINQEVSQYRDGKRQVQEQLKALQEGRQSQTGDLSEIFQQRDGFNAKIQEHIQERNQLRDEFRAKEREYNTYLREQRDKRQAQWQEEKAERNAEFEKKKRVRAAEALDNQPYVTEIGLVEQTMAFCKSFVSSKGAEEKEEKKEVEHKLDKGMELLATKEDRAEEYFFVPTAKKKSKGSKNKGGKAEGGTKAIRHNAMSFQFFDKLKLDAPITTDDVPPLLEKLQVLLDDYNEKVKAWAQNREEEKRKILEDGIMPTEKKAEVEEPTPEEAPEEKADE